MCEVVRQLPPFASFAEQGFLGAVRNTKPEGLDDACKDIELWAFIHAIAPFMQQVERLRPWSGACSCHEADLLRVEKVTCDNKCVRVSECFGQNIFCR